MREDQQLLAGLCSASSLQHFADQREALNVLSHRYISPLLESAAACMAAGAAPMPLQVHSVTACTPT
jgi:hypothetical protein